MSVMRMTCRRTLGRALGRCSTAVAIGAFLVASSVACVHALVTADGGSVLFPSLWSVCVAGWLPVLVSVLAMDVWNEEFRTGRIDLLLSAPVKERDLVLGKALGVFLLSALTTLASLFGFLVVLGLMSPASLEGLSTVSLVTGLGFVLLQNLLWSVVALAISAMTAHAAVSVCLSFALLVALPRGLWAGLAAWAADIRPLLGEMPLDAQVMDFSSGIVSTGTVLAYLVLVVAVLFVTTKSISKRRLNGRGCRGLRLTTTLSQALALAVAGSASLLAMRLDAKLDVQSVDRKGVVSQRLHDLLSESGGALTVTGFLSRDGADFRPVAHELRRLKHEADVVGGLRVAVRFVDPTWDTAAAQRLVRLGAKPGSIVFERGRRMTTMPLENGYGEGALMSAIVRTVTPPTRRTVYWTVGHGESSHEAYDPFGMSDIARELSKEGYVNATIDLAQDAQMPADCALVVVAGAKDDFSRVELGRLDAYLKHGGRLLTLLPGVAQGGVVSLLPSWGIRPELHALAEAKTLTGTDVVVSEFPSHAVSSPLNGSRIVLGRPVSFMPSAAVDGGVGADRLEYSPLAKIGLSAVAAAIERGSGTGQDLALRPTRIVVVGDASFVLNGQLTARASANRDFLLNCVAYLSGTNASAASGQTPGVFRMNLSRKDRLVLLGVLGGALPGLVLLGLLLVVLRRRRLS